MEYLLGRKEGRTDGALRLALRATERCQSPDNHASWQRLARALAYKANTASTREYAIITTLVSIPTSNKLPSIPWLTHSGRRIHLRISVPGLHTTHVDYPIPPAQSLSCYPRALAIRASVMVVGYGAVVLGPRVVASLAFSAMRMRWMTEMCLSRNIIGLLKR